MHITRDVDSIMYKILTATKKLLMSMIHNANEEVIINILY